jgi:predicted DNA-binding transcriptional regulator AlpA
MSDASKDDGREDGEAASDNRDDDRLINMDAVCEKFAECSPVKVYRLMRDDPSFPKPRYVGRRPLWWNGDIVRWIERQSRTKPHGDRKPRPAGLQRLARERA